MTIHQRRTDTEKTQVGNYFGGDKRYYDQISEHTIVKLYSGDCYVAQEHGEMLVTILGSCISACIRDPLLQLGGMNHFLLPETSDKSVIGTSSSARFGAYAMEQLINELLKRGAVKSRLEAKVFGGGNVIASSAMIGDKNVQFVRQFLKTEGIKIASEHLGGTSPRRIHYFPDTGKVMMRILKRKEDMQIIEEEKAYAKKLIAKPVEGDVELF